jgi:predicted O-linked N-acetylglucosamine transferase (SPINDLY family)
MPRRGGAFAGRVAASLLAAIGLPELITENLEAYERCALELALDPHRLVVLKQKLAQNRLTTPLFDADGFRREIEEAFVIMHKQAAID